MSPQSKPQSERKRTTSDLAQTAVGTQVPTIRPPAVRRFSFLRGDRRHRLRQRMLRARSPRPIHGTLVTHRRRFTTGHKHKQPYMG